MLVPGSGQKGRAWAKLDGNAPLAQLDRVVGFEPIGRGFESLRVRHLKNPFNFITLQADSSRCLELSLLWIK